MGQVLYRKYRSKNLSEIIGQEHITKTLENALKSGNISHAYLFTGPKGVGKTSIARILANEVNEFVYDEKKTNLDIIEIDAASNRRIDEIRDLRDKVHIAPISAKYKVYIIDEAHMLTKEAFNALLKTLEEPPEHVIFILATTEAHKLPETIISRTQRFTFKPIKLDQIVSHLRFIAKKEHIIIDDASLELIAKHGEGSFRDSISLLDQISNTADKIVEDDVRKVLGIASDEAIEKLTTFIRQGDTKQILTFLEELRRQGHDSAQISSQLAAKYRSKLVEDGSNRYIVGFLKELLDVPASSDPDQLLELVLLDNFPEDLTKEASIEHVSNPVISPEPIKKSEVPKLIKKTMPPDKWNTVLEKVKQKHNTLHGVLRMAEPTLDKNTLTLTFKFPFHEKKLKEPRNMATFHEILKQHYPHDIKVVTCVSARAQDAKKPSNTTQVEAISNIFGSAEVLES